jgi:EmrB/QacA subfamily drug resistance transporter
MGKWSALAVLAAAQFLMVLDAAVMNVSISQLVADFDTTVTTIQGVITAYALVMAALMMTGGKLGDIHGRRRIFMVGLVIYACGSFLTAISWNVPSLLLGWSILEGIGAAMVLPALAALGASNYQGKDRALMYGVLGGVAGAGIAVGPIVGGAATEYLSWRVVFAGEVVLAAFILVGTWFRVSENPAEGSPQQLDVVGAVLSASGMALFVFGILQASNWGWIKPKDSPVEPFGFSLAPFVVAAGVAVLIAFRAWQRRREEEGRDPLVHFRVLNIVPVRAGLTSLFLQNLVLMGVFFVFPLYLQIVQGLNAFDTGVRMLPISVTLVLAALIGSRLASRVAPRAIVRVGFLVLAGACVFLMGTIKPDIDSPEFGIGSAILGIGMGLVASQLGNVLQSSVENTDRSEAGALQNTAQQLGSSLGTAFIGAIVISSLGIALINNVQDDPRISAQVEEGVGTAVGGGITFVSADQVRDAATAAGISDDETDAIVEDYEDAQIQALKLGLLVSAALGLIAWPLAAGLPSKRLEEADELGPLEPSPEPSSA